jgi:hypothetical protein
LCFVCVLCVSFKIDDYGSRRGNMVQALNHWHHPVALSETPDELHRAMRPILYCCIRMATEIASNSPAFFVGADYLFAHNLS